MSLRQEMIAGAIGGLAGGLVMSAFMMGATKMGVVEETLPHKVEQVAEARFNRQARTSPRQEEAIAQGGHLAFSAMLGALYGALHYANPELPALPTGPLYGMGIYAANLAGIGPQLDITRGPWHEEPPTVMRRMMMHAVFGTVTALVQEKLVERQVDGSRAQWREPVATGEWNRLQI